jgi:hypothetical protein
MSKLKWRGQNMDHLTPKVGDILVNHSDGHFIEVLEITAPWTPDGPTWITVFNAIKIANKYGAAFKVKQPIFKTTTSQYHVNYDVDVPYNIDGLEKALAKAQKDLKTYKEFTAKHADKWTEHASVINAS